jgi:2-keto-4-pentenoate hydratase
MQTIESGAHFLAEARIRHERLAELPGQARPKTIDEAYQCQELLAGELTRHYGGYVAGYKIACTNALAQKLLNLDHPFHGKLISSTCFDSPARVKAGDFFMRVMEAEFGFLMARDLPPGSQPLEREEVAAAVAGVLPSIEIVDSRFTSWTTVGTPSLIADNACHGAWIKGPLVTDWRQIDLAAQEVQLIVNGQVVQRGSGSAVLGHPLTALQWLANTLSARGLGLKKGQHITTGVTTDIYLAERGDRVRADFGAVGSVELTFE